MPWHPEVALCAWHRNRDGSALSVFRLLILGWPATNQTSKPSRSPSAWQWPQRWRWPLAGWQQWSRKQGWQQWPASSGRRRAGTSASLRPRGATTGLGSTFASRASTSLRAGASASCGLWHTSTWALGVSAGKGATGRLAARKIPGADKHCCQASRRLLWRLC